MPARSQTRLRRDLNRLTALIETHLGVQPALAAIQSDVAAAAQLVNDRWQRYQAAVIADHKERGERDAAISRVGNWVRSWRQVVLLKVPGALSNLRALPPSGATPDDQLRVAEDLKVFIESSPAAEGFRDAALTELATALEDARKETAEAQDARVAEDGARAALTEASLSANQALVRGVEIVRAIFGPRSPEARQFRLRASAGTVAEAAEQETEEDAESELGEG